MAIRKVKTAATNHIRGTFDLATFNEEQRTVDVTFATPTPVLMGYYDRFYEVLSFQEGHIRLDRLNAGAPMLDSHATYTRCSDQPGVVERAWVENNEGRATLRFANDEDGSKLMAKVKDKIVRNVSVGYQVFRYEETPQAVTETLPTYRATDWEPYEISFVGIPADINAGVRSANQNQEPAVEVELDDNSSTSNNQSEMFINTRRLQRDAGGAGEANGGGGAAQATPAANASTATATPAATDEGEGQRSAQQQQRSGAPVPAATPAATTTATEQPAQSGDATSSRALAILAAAEPAGVSMEFARGLISDPNVTVEAAVERIRQQWIAGDQARTQSANRGATAGNDQRIARQAAMSDAIRHRALPSHFENGRLPDASREFRGMTLLDMARECLVESGVVTSTRGMSPREIGELALNVGGNTRGGMMSTSDFPLILGNTINRVLREEYEIQERTFMPFVRRKSAKDFRLMTSVQTGELDDLDLIVEGGEYKRASFGEAQESWKVAKYGKIIPFTWEAIVNDDLNAFSDLSVKYANAAARKQSDIVWAMILGNPVMGDGKTLFHADHGNITAAAAIDINSFGVARATMRKQKGLDGRDLLNLTPQYLLVGPDNEQLALQYTSNSYSPVLATTQNVWKGLVTPIVEPRITTLDWYFVADSRRIPTIDIAFLEGESELFTEQRTGFDVDGLEVKVRMVFGAKAQDWRAFTKTPHL